jgi:hypothetical protein
MRNLKIYLDTIPMVDFMVFLYSVLLDLPMFWVYGKSTYGYQTPDSVYISLSTTCKPNTRAVLLCLSAALSSLYNRHQAVLLCMHYVPYNL